MLTGSKPPALHRVEVPLGRGNQHHRLIYGFPRFISWVEGDLPLLQPGRLKSHESPKQQLDNFLYRWIAGKDILYDRMFKDLTPMKDEVWECKTVDIRVFGWMYRPKIFIAVFGDYADLYKGITKTRSYVSAVDRVKDARSGLDIDEPKFSTGTFRAYPVNADTR